MTFEQDQTDGMILVRKPTGLSSNKVVNIVKYIFNAKKAGHTGTLDPFASGLLPVCLNKATRLARYLLGKDKEYIGVIKLGEKTDTLDLTGKIIKKSPVPSLSDEEINKASLFFTGKLKQSPPAYSAVKHKGVPLYKHARKGNIIIKEPREIEVFAFEILDINLPFITIRVRCSAGTYIRSLASDFSEKLGTTGTLQSLERTKCGDFLLEDALSTESLKGMDEKENRIISLNKIIEFMPEIKVSDSIEYELKNGRKILSENINGTSSLEINKPFRLVSTKNELIAVVRKEEDSIFLKYDAVFN
ncbi:MAG: tRNA pseudouridine(55) synthase TruB [Deltaproteobacteria bacterium]|nr:MAG: tRNA pseudouridine(55) synthase TruB [Deltaproteobacteria bacterium]